VKILNSFQGYAEGELYLDDGHSLDYQNGGFSVRKFVFQEESLFGSSKAAGKLNFKAQNSIEKIVILGLKRKVKMVVVEDAVQTVEFASNQDGSVLVLKKPGMTVDQDFVIRLV
jgi:alpha 1,3-glucosidase